MNGWELTGLILGWFVFGVVALVLVAAVVIIAAVVFWIVSLIVKTARDTLRGVTVIESPPAEAELVQANRVQSTRLFPPDRPTGDPRG